jgi:valyl-tRNA synthetase
MITVIDHEGNMSHEVPGVYRGHSVDSARQLIVDDLKELGILEKEEEYSHSVGHCYKCGSVIQPLLREQWFIDMQPLATRAIKALHDGEITFYPAAKKDQLITYLKGLRDWNISRQIAWGIPIPAFQNIDDPDDWMYDERVGEETITIGKKTYRRDPDVFDTWFSSSSWPYATLGYPDGDDFKQFYPVSLMETGGEILYPWVSRMIMLGLFVTGKVPFEAVYIHGYVMAEDGAKMSKSLGNVINPLDVIKEYGSDALRMGIIAGRAPAVNRGYDSRKVIDARNFCNKLWNLARYVEDKLEGKFDVGKPKAETAADEWLLTKLQHITERVSADLDKYRFSEACDNLYHFVWDDFADWYIEASKIHLNKAVLAYGLEVILKLAHPFAPFVTETIWQTLHGDQDNLLITAAWPEAVAGSTKGAGTFEDIMTLVSEIRFITATTGVTKPRLYHRDDEFIVMHAELIQKLAGVSEVKAVSDGSGLNLTQSGHDCWLDLDHDTINHFVKQLAGKLEATKKSIAQLEGRLGNKAYVDKAPKQLVDETKQHLADAKELLAKQQAEHDRFTLKSED